MQRRCGLFVSAPSATMSATSAVAVLATAHRGYSTFAVNMETQRPATGTPRGHINRMLALGLPPWAAWTRNINDRHAHYRMSGASKLSFLPKYPHEMEHIWLNEQVRERVRSVTDKQKISRELKYPYTLTGVWYSDALDHWIQLPHVKAAQYAIERDGGFDNFVLKRPGPELRSRYGERLRRHILVRQREIEKNFLLQKSAEKLADKIVGESSGDDAPLDAVLGKYGLDRAEIVRAAQALRQERA